MSEAVQIVPDSLADHFLNRLNQAETRDAPTPFCTIENVFDDATYASLLDHWPSFLGVESLKLKKETYDDRRLLQLTEESLDAFDPEPAQIWKTVRTVFTSKKAVEGIVRKFPSILLPRLQASAGLSLDVRLCEDLRGYVLGPHTDAAYKLFTMLIYMPSDADHVRFGTRFYKAEDPAFADNGSSHFDFDGFIEVEAASYLPNTATLFPRTDRSFHGVLTLDDPDYVRRSLVINAYIQ